MPRQDVPYGGAICRLKERLAEIWDKLGEKLHSINGVEGDAAGNVEIVSGDAAITITDDQVNHQITIGLDQAELPSAAVTSVNGRTGDVILHSSDIGADGGVSVQGALDNLASADTTLQGNINAEALARQGADSTLQTNINNITASLPSQVIAAVAADPTIALLVAADSDNVKLTGNQSISGVKTVPTQATGTYDQQIANSTKVRNDIFNWAVTQTGAQTVAGNKTFTGAIISNRSASHFTAKDPNNTISGGNAFTRNIIICTDGNDAEIGSIRVNLASNGVGKIDIRVRNADGTFKTVVIAEGDP